MKRHSFLGQDTETLQTCQWEVVGLGVCNVAFGLCRDSGLVMQTESVTPDQMTRFYENTATYVNADGKPTARKVRDVERLIGIVDQHAHQWPGRVFQVGSSDGYTLSRFRAAGSEVVLGLDPGQHSVRFARDVYGIDTVEGTIESEDLPGVYDHVVLTHILEHLYDPTVCLKKCYNSLTERGSLLVEVPLWEWMHHQPLGVLTFEHLNYFCEETLCRLLRQEGFEPIFIGKYAKENHYPVITAFAQKGVTGASEEPVDARVYSRNRQRLELFLEREASLWDRARENFRRQVNPDRPIYIYGAGIHTAQMLAHQVLGPEPSIAGVFDSSPTKWSKSFGHLPIQPGDAVAKLPEKVNVVVSTYASEPAVVQFLEGQAQPLNIIPLHNP